MTTPDPYVLVTPGTIICPECHYAMKARADKERVVCECCNYKCSRNGVEYSVAMLKAYAVPVIAKPQQ